jgi:vacuolar protein sorting-associated protein 13B
MGYIDKYVKLKPDDFQLSLWGGDAVLGKLDLRLDVIEHAIQLPIVFKSGFIHELRIHVPWTRLYSEPVVITINTIECIVKLRDSSAGSDTSSVLPRSESTSSVASRQAKAPSAVEGAEDLPPGYLQSLLNKILHNMNVVVNNLILKFFEDDIVLSLNIKSAECYSVDGDWKRSFVELALPELVLRRVLDFHDLTLCLDRRNASGRIEMYQDPILYR